MNHLFYFAMAMALFVTVNVLGRNIGKNYVSLGVLLKEEDSPAFNFLYRLAAPTVYILILASILIHIGQTEYLSKLYLVAIYYAAFRIFYNLLCGRFHIVNWKREIIMFTLLSFLSYLAQKRVIDSGQFHFPDSKTLAEQAWLLIIAFLYQTANNLKFSSRDSIKRKRIYIKKKFLDFESKFGNIVDSELAEKELRNLVFAIMVHEDFNRPLFTRYVEYAISYFSTKPMTLGIMQVQSRRVIDDSESLKIALDKINRDFESGVISFRERNSHLDKKMLERCSKIEGRQQMMRLYNGGSAYQKDITELEGMIAQMKAGIDIVNNQRDQWREFF